MNARYLPLLFLFPWFAHSQLPELSPVLGQRGDLIHSADFDSPDARPPETKLGKCEIIAGALRLEERQADHHQAAVSLYRVGSTGHTEPLTDFLMQADFQWSGAKNFQFGLNRLPALAKKATDGKHWEVAPHCLTIAFRQPSDPQKPREWVVDDNSVEPFLCLGKLPVTLEPGKWYRILLEVRRNEVCVQLSNGQTIRGQAKNPNDPKSAPILRCQGEEGKGVTLDNVQVWKVR